MARITIRGLTKHYESEPRPALCDLCLEIEDGELLVLVGPSGCGKSTALRIIAGLEQPDRGTVRLGDRDLGSAAPQDRDIAMVFQGYALYPHLRVREIIGFPLKMRGVARAERERRIRETAQLVGLEPLLERRPGQLSGGEQQRVAMARAIVRSPKAFLFDEPLSHLDAKLRAELRVELARLVRRLGVTSIYVTHDQAEAMTMGDRVAVLQAGELQQVGPPRAIYEQPDNLFVAGFLGTPAMNLIELECADGIGHASGIRLDLPVAIADQAELTVGIRPEHVRIELGEQDASPYRRPPDGSALTIEARVIAAEPLGAETFLYLDADGTMLRTRVPGLDAPAVDQRVRAVVALERLLWFATQSGARLAVEPP